MVTLIVLFAIWFATGLYATVDLIRNHEDFKLCHVPGALLIALLLGPTIYLDFEVTPPKSTVLFKRKK